MNDKKKSNTELTMIVALSASSLLDEHLSQLKSSMEEEDFNDLKLAVGKCMGVMHTELLGPIWKNPHLLPEQMGGSYKVDDTLQKEVIQLCKEFHLKE